MFLLDLLRLLRVALFHLLFLLLIVILLSCLLVFFFLLLLEPLVILRLLFSQLVLLLLIFFFGCGIASVRRRKLVRLQLAGVTVSVGRRSGVFCRTILSVWASLTRRTRFIATCSVRRRSLVRTAGLSGSYDSGLEVSGLGGSRDRRFALVGGST